MNIYVDEEGRWNTSPFEGAREIDPKDAEPMLVIAAASEHAERAFARARDRLGTCDGWPDEAYDVEYYEMLHNRLLQVWEGRCSILAIVETDVDKEAQKMWHDVGEYVQYMDKLEL